MEYPAVQTARQRKGRERYGMDHAGRLANLTLGCGVRGGIFRPAFSWDDRLVQGTPPKRPKMTLSLGLYVCAMEFVLMLCWRDKEMTKESRETKPSPSAGTSIDDLMRRNDGLTDEQRKAMRDFVMGGISLLVGLTVTILTLVNVVNTGWGGYLLAWGPIIFGGERCFQGFRKLKTGR